MNGFGNLDETYRACLLAHADDLIRFQISKVKVTAGRVEVNFLVWYSCAELEHCR